jgi:VanZ family protein
MNKIKIVLVLIWMIIIFLFSNQPATESSKTSSSFISHTITKIIKKDNNYVVNKYEKIVRKCAHFFLYFVLGILVFNCYNEKELLYALIICLLYSISDEIHQIFIVGRSCELFDIFIDTIGSFFGINILNIIRKNIKNK